MRRSLQVREGDRWVHKKSQRLAIVTKVVSPDSVEYKYVQPTNPWYPWYPHPAVSPYTRRTRVSRQSFVTSFAKERVR